MVKTSLSSLDNSTTKNFLAIKGIDFREQSVSAGMLLINLLQLHNVLAIRNLLSCKHLSEQIADVSKSGKRSES